MGRWTEAEEKELRKLYADSSISIRKIIAVLGRSPASIHNKISCLGIKKFRSPRKYKSPSKLTSALARIHAHICGDGNLFRFKEKDSYGYLGYYKPGRYRYRCGIGYTNFNHGLITEFMEDIKATFGLKPYYYNHYVRVKSRDVWKLLKDLGAGKSREWFIDKRIIKADKEIKKNWLRAFFDDEACYNDRGRIRVRSVNREGLTQVATMLNEFTPCHITPEKNYYPDHSVYLNINKKDVSKYFSKIGSLRYRNNIKNCL